MDFETAIKKYKVERYESDQARYNDIENLRKEFISKFSIEKVKNMSLDDYVLGKDNWDSFCYWVETKTRELGSMQGATSLKFGLYFARKEEVTRGIKDSEGYVFSTKYSNRDEAFEDIRNELIKLIVAGANNDYATIDQCNITPMFKGKILSLYYLDKYICISSPEHIAHFTKKLGLSDSNNIFETKEKIAKTKFKNNISKDWNNYIYENFLYYWAAPLQVSANILTEEQTESYFNEKDPNASFVYEEKLVKARKINVEITKELKKIYGNCCQLCGKAFDGKYGDVVTEGHHIDYFSKSQNNDANNIMIVCPNHHRIIHKMNPTFDRETLSFKYKNGYIDKIILDKHLKNGEHINK